MARYYVSDNAQNNGDHEVHVQGCSHISDLDNRTFLGDFTNCSDAVRAAKKVYAASNGCYYCCNPCHTS